MNNHKQVKEMLKDFYPFAKKRFGFDRAAKIILNPDVENSKKPLGKTAYYDPQSSAVTVYTHNRHPKDIMRSISHELVHHAQNCRGDLTNVAGEQGQGYAQNNEHLREMEREAYEQGNLCFRDWEDGIKSNLEPGTIYEKRSITTMGTVKDHLNQRDALRVQKLFEKFGYKAPTQEAVGGPESLQGKDVRILSGGLSGAEGEVIELTTSTQGEPAVVVLLKKNADQRVFGQAGDEVIALVSDVEADEGIQSGDDSVDPEDDYNWVGHRAHYEEGQLEEDNCGSAKREDDKEEKLSAKQSDKMDKDKDGDIDGEDLKALRKNENEKKHDDGDSKDEKCDYIDCEDDKEEKNENLTEALKAVFAKNPKLINVLKESGLSSKQIIKKVLGQIEEGVKVDGRSPADMALVDKIAELMSSDPEFKILKPYVDKFVRYSQSGGSVESSLEAAVPDFVAGRHLFAIMKKAQGGQMEEAANNVIDGEKAEKMWASIVDNTPMRGDAIEADKLIAAVAEENPDISPEEIQAFLDALVQQKSIRRIADEDFGDEYQMMTEGFRDSDEEKEMMSKMSNKEFYKYVTRDRHVVPNLKGDMDEIPGMEGPFQFKSGAVLYYDPKAGKYYDRGKDMYIDNEEAANLTMEENQPGSSDEVDAAKQKGMKTDVQRVAKFMFTHKQLGPALDKIKGDATESAQLLALVSQQLGVKPEEISTLVTKVKGAMKEAEGEVFEAGDKVVDDRNGKTGTVTEPMAGGAVIKLEDGEIVKVRDKFLSKVEPTVMKEFGEEDYSGLTPEQIDMLAASLSEEKTECPNGCNCNEKNEQLSEMDAGGEVDAIEFANKHMLSAETDNEGQVVIYVDQDQQAQLRASGGDRVIADEGWTVEPVQGVPGQVIIYTGQQKGEYYQESMGGGISPEQFANEHGLDLQTDNDGQKIIYIDRDTEVSMQAADQIKAAGWDVEQDNSGNIIIYTGQGGQMMEMKGGMTVEQFADAFDLTPQRDNDGQIFFNAFADGGLKDQEIMKQAELAGFDVERDNDGAMVIYTGQGGEEPMQEMYDDDDYGEEDPYMAGLEAEFPWMKDKPRKGRKPSMDDEAAMAAAMADSAGEFATPEEEEEDEFADPLREWWSIRNDKKAKKLFEWAVKGK